MKNKNLSQQGLLIFMTTIVLGLTLLYYQNALAQNSSVTDIKQKIDSNKSNIQKIDAEIKKYKKHLTSIRKKKRTLKSTINELNSAKNKTLSSINAVKSDIEISKGKIDMLSKRTEYYSEKITKNTDTLIESLKQLQRMDDDTFVEHLLDNNNLSNIWTTIDNLAVYQKNIHQHVVLLKQEHKKLLQTKSLIQKENNKLFGKVNELQTHKKQLEIRSSEKDKILKQTKNKEGEYQRILSAKRNARKRFEKELNSYEARLRYVLDKSKLPTGQGALSWPTNPHRLTQYFGNTPFASKGAYNGKGHNGIDIGIPVGTPVKAAGGGIVKATGNTDAYNGCYSYGKWIVITHKNGLSTLYAHLSKISVTKGQKIAHGQLIAYSGNTGYSTGPHLHFTVFASDAVRIVRMGEIKKRTNCTNAIVPVAATKGYLNPLNYLLR